MSISQNTVVKSISPKSIFDDATNVLGDDTTFNQGDNLYFNNTTKKISGLAAESDADRYLGVARVKVVNGKLAQPYETASSSREARGGIPGPVYGVVAFFQLKNGDVLEAGADVYADPSSGAQFVQDTGTKPIGTYQGGAITGGTNTTVEVLIGARFPNDTLKY